MKGIVSVSHQSLIPIYYWELGTGTLNLKGLGGLDRKLYLLFYYKRVGVWDGRSCRCLVGGNTGEVYVFIWV